MKEYDTYIFDLDGTLLCTLEDLAASTNYALRKNGMPEHSIDEIRMFVGNGVKKLMQRAIPNGENNPKFEQTYALFRQHYLEHNLDTTHPYEGIPELLAELKRRGKHLAIVSNKFYTATQELARHFFPDTIEVAIGEREGDSDVDIMTAKNCNLPCISVLWGFRDKNFLIEHGGTTFVHHPKEILF